MSPRLQRQLIALSGLLGTVCLAIYFLAAPPLPPANATVQQVVSVATQYHDKWFVGAWLQATGTLLSVVFFMGLAQMSGGMARLSGALTLLGSSVLLATTLAEGAFTIDLAQAAVNGHGVTALTSYDIMSVFIHVFPLAPAPLVFLALGTSLLGGDALPRVLGILALLIGAVFAVVGLVGLLTTPILTLVPLGCEALWTLAAAITLALRTPGSETLNASVKK